MSATGVKTGVWLVGARGSVATTAVVGALAVAAGMAPRTGCVTEASDFADVPLPGLDDLVFGGHDIATTPLTKRAELLADAGVVPHHLPTLLAAELDRVDDRIRSGRVQEGETQRAQIVRLASDVERFRTENGLDRVVVVNVSSTEPPVDARPEFGVLGALDAALDRGESVLPTSSLYAYAAFLAGSAWVDFTPSTGARLPALDELATERGLPHAGSDGKTGETLVKSVLAPMFTQRNLRVRSWVGMNILGGGDGETLADPNAVLSKTRSKARGLEAALGYPVDAPVHIDNIPDMGEWKTAWDHISFEGFLGTRMAMQFTWQGCDSTLAAPLVLDLARLATLALRTGVVGAVPELGFFFKDPLASGEHSLAEQWATLVSWARSRA